jgi:YidC/Oxa1 family membrane protein insertase
MFGSPIVAVSNPVFHAVGQIFQPVLRIVADALALIYGVIPNYAIAIAILTILIMTLLTPLTVKSTKSMIAMQRMQPEIKKLQAKYKGPENRQKLNEELMKVYKDQGINPLGGCLPMFLQMPFLYILFDVIKGLTAVTKSGAISPRYIPKPANLHATAVPLIDKMYVNLIQGHGQLRSFGMDFALKPFSHHSSTVAAIPYFVLVVLAVGLGYLQMTQMSRRNPQAAAANKQMQSMQKIMPIIFGYIYFVVPAAVVIYMIVSTMIRIATQDIMFRTGVVKPVNAERAIGGAKGGALPAGAAGLVAGGDSDAGTKTPPKTTPSKTPQAKTTPPKTTPSKTAPAKTNGQARPAKPALGARAQSGGNGQSPRTNGAARPSSGTTNGKPTADSDDGESDAAKPHTRSKNKRDRRTR